MIVAVGRSSCVDIWTVSVVGSFLGGLSPVAVPSSEGLSPSEARQLEASPRVVSVKEGVAAEGEYLRAVVRGLKERQDEAHAYLATLKGCEEEVCGKAWEGGC